MSKLKIAIALRVMMYIFLFSQAPLFYIDYKSQGNIAIFMVAIPIWFILQSIQHLNLYISQNKNVKSNGK